MASGSSDEDEELSELRLSDTLAAPASSAAADSADTRRCFVGRDGAPSRPEVAGRGVLRLEDAVPLRASWHTSQALSARCILRQVS